MCNLYNIKASRAEFNAYFQASDDLRGELTVEKDYVSPSKPAMSSARSVAPAGSA